MTFGSGIEMTGKERLRLPAEYAGATEFCVVFCVHRERQGLSASHRRISQAFRSGLKSGE
jgi:hypothetical protein